MKEGKQFEVLKWAVVIVIVFALYKILMKVGLIKSAKEEKEERIMEEKLANISTGWYWTNSPKSPDPIYKFWQGFKDKGPKGDGIGGSADAFAKKIWDAIGGLLSDNEEAIYGVFRQLITQSQVMHISKSFTRLYGEDLGLKLKQILSPTEMVTVIDIIEKKPKGLSKDGKTWV